MSPPQENNAFFVTTNVIITPNQTQGSCPEAPNVPGARCKPANNTCKSGQSLPLGHGVNTGKCVKNDAVGEIDTCEILAWCPVERDVQPLRNRGLLEASKEFTVLIKNHIEFPAYGKRRSNILDSSNQSYLQSCLYDVESDPFCPVFRLETIVTLAGENYTDVAVNGTVISVGIDWNCDLGRELRPPSLHKHFEYI